MKIHSFNLFAHYTIGWPLSVGRLVGPPRVEHAPSMRIHRTHYGTVSLNVSFSWIFFSRNKICRIGGWRSGSGTVSHQLTSIDFYCILGSLPRNHLRTDRRRRRRCEFISGENKHLLRRLLFSTITTRRSRSIACASLQGADCTGGGDPIRYF